jgi:ATP/maltotriose-dependent transcriptional regulator MalT
MSAWACLLLGDRAEADRRMKAALRAARAHRHIFSKTYGFGIIASFHQTRGDPVAALDFANLALKLSREQNNRYWESWAQIVRGWALAAQGQHEEGITALAQGIEMYAATGSRLILRYARALLAEAHYHAGSVSEGMRIARELEDTQAGSEVHFFDLVAERIFARLRSAPAAKIARGDAGETEDPRLAPPHRRYARGRPNRPRAR